MKKNITWDKAPVELIINGQKLVGKVKSVTTYPEDKDIVTVNFTVPDISMEYMYRLGDPNPTRHFAESRVQEIEITYRVKK